MGQRDREGYLMVDHRNAGAPMPDEAMRLAGLPAGSGRGLFEAATITCHGCQKTWAVNRLRTRPRNYCKKHDRYLCDGCAARVATSGVCRSFKEIIDMAAEAAIKGIPFESPFK